MNPPQLIEDLTLVPLPQWWESPWFLLGAPVVAGLLLYALTRWWMSRPRRVPAAVVPAGPPVHDAFLALLADLRRRSDGLAAYPLGIEVSEILRGYLEAQYRFGIRYQTTREFLDSVSADGRFNPVHRATLAGFLGRCDAVKFARGDATAEQRLGLVDTAERFIRDCAGVADSAAGANREEPRP